MRLTKASVRTYSDGSELSVILLIPFSRLDHKARFQLHYLDLSLELKASGNPYN